MSDSNYQIDILDIKKNLWRQSIVKTVDLDLQTYWTLFFILVRSADDHT